MAAPKSPNTEAARAALDAKRHAQKIEAARQLLRAEDGYLVMSRDEVAHLLTQPMYRTDGFSPAWLRGYFGISESDDLPE